MFNMAQVMLVFHNEISKEPKTPVHKGGRACKMTLPDSLFPIIPLRHAYNDFHLRRAKGNKI